MSKVFNRAQSRILSKRVKAKFTPDKEDLTKVRVVSGGVAQVAGQVYNSATGGFRAGEVVEATNIGTAGNAHYVAKFSSSNSLGLDGAAIRRALQGLGDSAIGGWSESELQKKIDEAINKLPDPVAPIITPTPTSASPITRTVDDIIRDTVGPIASSSGGATITVRIPDTTEEGDFMVMVVHSRLETDEADSYYATHGDWPLGFQGDGAAPWEPWSKNGWGRITSQRSLTFLDGAYPAPVEYVLADTIWKEAGASEGDTEYTFTFKAGALITNSIYYLIILKGDYIIATDSLYDNNGYHDQDGWAYEPDETSNLVVGAVDLETNYSFCLVHSCTFGSVTITPAGSWQELVDFQSSQISMFVMMKKFPTAGNTGWIRGYMTDSDAFYGAIGIEIMQVDV